MKRRTSWLYAIVLTATTSRCGARFEDLRDPRALAVDSGASAAPDVDAGTNAPSDAGAEVVIAAGTWMGRNGESASGGVELVRLADGGEALRFKADFEVGGTPAPVVVMSTRDTLGTQIDPSQGDVELGVLAQPSGAQSYGVPGGDNGRRSVFVFCKTYGVETARAILSEVK
jgi:hypothetical protein